MKRISVLDKSSQGHVDCVDTSNSLKISCVIIRLYSRMMLDFSTVHQVPRLTILIGLILLPPEIHALHIRKKVAVQNFLFSYLRMVSGCHRSAIQRGGHYPPQTYTTVLLHPAAPFNPPKQRHFQSLETALKGTWDRLDPLAPIELRPSLIL